MSEIEIKQMQEKINAGILLARKRLIEKSKKKMANWSLSGMENRPPQSQGPQITPLTLKQRLYPRPYGRGFLHVSGMRKSIATEKPRISRLFCFLYIQPQLFDGLIFIIDFPADGTYGPVIDDKGSVLLFLEHVDNKFAILRIPAVIQGDLEIETALTGFRNGRSDRITFHIRKCRPQNMVENG